MIRVAAQVNPDSKVLLPEYFEKDLFVTAAVISTSKPRIITLTVQKDERTISSSIYIRVTVPF